MLSLKVVADVGMIKSLIYDTTEFSSNSRYLTSALKHRLLLASIVP
jgi:hypothetical protein